jgi:hypothetical protein
MAQQRGLALKEHKVPSDLGANHHVPIRVFEKTCTRGEGSSLAMDLANA